MLNITVINCDNKYITYEWNDAKEFVTDMESDKECIPMLDDVIAEIETDNNGIYEYWTNNLCNVNELYEYCKKHEKESN